MRKAATEIYRRSRRTCWSCNVSGLHHATVRAKSTRCLIKYFYGRCLAAVFEDIAARADTILLLASQPKKASSDIQSVTAHILDDGWTVRHKQSVLQIRLTRNGKNDFRSVRLQPNAAAALVAIVGSQKPSGSGFVAAIHPEALLRKQSACRGHVGGERIQFLLKFLRPVAASFRRHLRRLVSWRWRKRNRHRRPCTLGRS